jgi:RNA polymerase sigma factor (sigma-70 family)
MSALAAVAPRTDVSSPEAYAERLYEDHHRAIFAFCLNRLRRREDADDAVQLTFIYALLSLRRGVVPELELPWLFTIARNVCSTRRRNGKRRGEFESPQDFDAIQERLAVPEPRDVAGAEDFTAALRDIPENQRKAILLREWKGLSYDEIGTELGLSRGATEALLFRARQNVARRLEGVKALQGLPFLSFLRNLFQGAAAKTIAVGAGAALTVAAVPSADTSTPPVSAPRTTPVVHTTSVRNDVRRPSVDHVAPPSRSSARRDVGASARVRDAGQTDAGQTVAAPGPAGDMPQTSDASVSGATVASTSPNTSTSAGTNANTSPTPTRVSTPAPAPALPVPVTLPVASDAPAEVLNTVDNVVDNVVDTVSNTVSNTVSSLPTPALPVTPPVSMTVPQLPSVHLP